MFGCRNRLVSKCHWLSPQPHTTRPSATGWLTRTAALAVDHVDHAVVLKSLVRDRRPVRQLPGLHVCKCVGFGGRWVDIGFGVLEVCVVGLGIGWEEEVSPARARPAPRQTRRRHDTAFHPTHHTNHPGSRTHGHVPTLSGPTNLMSRGSMPTSRETSSLTDLTLSVGSQDKKNVCVLRLIRTYL